MNDLPDELKTKVLQYAGPCCIAQVLPWQSLINRMIAPAKLESKLPAAIHHNPTMWLRYAHPIVLWNVIRLMMSQYGMAHVEMYVLPTISTRQDLDNVWDLSKIPASLRLVTRHIPVQFTEQFMHYCRQNNEYYRIIEFIESHEGCRLGGPHKISFLENTTADALIRDAVYTGPVPYLLGALRAYGSDSLAGPGEIYWHLIDEPDMDDMIDHIKSYGMFGPDRERNISDPIAFDRDNATLLDAFDCHEIWPIWTASVRQYIANPHAIRCQ